MEEYDYWVKLLNKQWGEELKQGGKVNDNGYAFANEDELENETLATFPVALPNMALLPFFAMVKIPLLGSKLRIKLDSVRCIMIMNTTKQLCVWSEIGSAYHGARLYHLPRSILTWSVSGKWRGYLAIGVNLQLIYLLDLGGVLQRGCSILVD